MIKKLTNKKAFTLTELIVVIVIIGILAAVLIPSLTGYITRARETAAIQEAQSYVTAYNTWVIEEIVSETPSEALAAFKAYCVNEIEMSEGEVAKIVLASRTGFTINTGNFSVAYVASTGALTTAAPIQSA